MPFDFSRLLQSIEIRARRVRGLSVASAATLYGALTSLIATVGTRLLHILLPSWSLLAFAVPPFLVGAVAYAWGRSRQPAFPNLLLHVDDTLGLDARFSSLYELRHRGGQSVFSRRIEAAVRDASDWRRALPVGRPTILRASASVCCVATVIGMSFVPLPVLVRSKLELVDHTVALSSVSVSEDVGSLAAPVKQSTHLPSAPIRGDSNDAAKTPLTGPPEQDHTLEDVMRDLSGISPNEALLSPIPRDEIDELARREREARRAIAELLEDIRERLENAPSSGSQDLTDQERSDLQRELGREGLPPGMQEGINELLNQPEHRTAEEMVEQLIERFGENEESETPSSEDPNFSPPQSTAVAPSAQNIDDLLESLGQSSLDEEGGIDVEVPAPPGEKGEPSEGASGEPSTTGHSGEPGPDGSEDPDLAGGTAGSGGLPGEDGERTPDFLREEERANIGASGTFVNEYVTEGVPIESMPSTDGNAPSLRVSYERIVSILRERGLPDGAIEIVRDYFNAITEGGT